jgi:hypothetical protein
MCARLLQAPPTELHGTAGFWHQSVFRWAFRWLVQQPKPPEATSSALRLLPRAARKDLGLAGHEKR